MANDDQIATAVRSKLGDLRRCREGWLGDIERLKGRLAEARAKVEEYTQEIADVRADAARLCIKVPDER